MLKIARWKCFRIRRRHHKFRKIDFAAPHQDCETVESGICDCQRTDLTLLVS